MGGYSHAFEDLMLPRLHATKREEASKEVFDFLHHGEDLGTAVAHVIEMLPQSKTRRLRAWTAQLDAFMDWQRWAEHGWELSQRNVFARTGERISILAPVEAATGREYPSVDAVAAAAGAGEVCFVGMRGGNTGKTPSERYVIYEVVRGI